MRARMLFVRDDTAYTAVWGAPVALADPGDDIQGPPSSSATSGSDAEQQRQAQEEQDHQQALEDQPRHQQEDQLRLEQLEREALQQPSASLSLAQTAVKQGGSFDITAVCSTGAGSLTSGGDISFSGLTMGTVGWAASPNSNIYVVLTCTNGPKDSRDQVRLTVLPGDDR